MSGPSNSHRQHRRTLALAIAVSVDDLVTAIHVRSRIVRNLIDFTPEATRESEDIEARLRSYLENPGAVSATDSDNLPPNISTHSCPGTPIDPTTTSNLQELGEVMCVEGANPAVNPDLDEFLEFDENLTAEYVKMRCAGDIPPTPVVSPGPKKQKQGKRPAEDITESTTGEKETTKRTRVSKE